MSAAKKFVDRIYPKTTKINDISQLKPGDHLIAHRPVLLLEVMPYDHHGVYVGDSKVVHFGIERKTKIKKFSDRMVFDSKGIKTSFEEFEKFTINGNEDVKCEIFRLEYDPARKVLSTDEVLKRAEDSLKESAYRQYDLFTYNCEHFAAELKTGEAYSFQADRPLVKYILSLGAHAYVIAEKILTYSTLFVSFLIEKLRELFGKNTTLARSSLALPKGVPLGGFLANPMVLSNGRIGEFTICNSIGGLITDEGEVGEISLEGLPEELIGDWLMEFEKSVEVEDN